MPGIPAVYRKSSEGAVASYDYYDFAEGTGIKMFYGASQAISGATTYFLTENAVYSKVIETGGDNATHADYTLVSDIDFDLAPFNMPKTIGGKALFNFFQKAYSGGVCSGANLIRVRKWNGTTETEIASVWTDGLTNIDGTHRYNFVLAPLTIPDTHFKRGEQLRVTVQQYLMAVTNAATIVIGTDPQNRDGAVNYIVPSTDAAPTSTTQFKCYIPFKIDI